MAKKNEAATVDESHIAAESAPAQAPSVPESRTYVAEGDFLNALRESITGTGAEPHHRVVDLVQLVATLAVAYPTVKSASIRQRIYKINKALTDRRKFVIAAGPSSRRRNIELYMDL